LKGKEKQAQIKSIKEGKPRPKTSAKSKPSSATVAFNKKYGKRLDEMKGGRSKKNIAKVTGIPFKALDAVYRKGEALISQRGRDRIKPKIVGDVPGCTVTSQE